eukprot:SM000008S22190  [mRNA]  locus=s8:341700:344444:+ [translate_table: standard]
MAGAPALGAIEAAHAAISDALCSCRINKYSGLHGPAPPPTIVVTVARVLDVMPTSLERDITSPQCDTAFPVRVKVTVADTGQGVPVTTLVEHYNQLFRTFCKPAPSDVHLRNPVFVITAVASDILIRAYEMRTADLPSDGALVILQCPCIEKTQETRLSGTTLSFEAEGRIEELLVFIHDQFNAVTTYKDGCLIMDSSHIIQALEHGIDWSRYGLDYDRAFISSPGRANMTFKHAGLTGKGLEIFVHEIGAYPGQMHASASRTSSGAAYCDASQSRLVKIAVQKALDKSKLRGPTLLPSTSQKKVVTSA